MIKRLQIKNLTVFSEADLLFAPQLNVIVGENGAGKTHLLKMAYAVSAAQWEGGRKASGGPGTPSAPTKSGLQVRVAEKLVNVFRAEALGRLASRQQGHSRCEIDLAFDQRDLGIAFDFSTQSKAEVNLTKLPKAWPDTAPAYLPTRELLTIYPNFVSVYEGHYLEFEETWRDTCLLLGAPVQRGAKEKRVRELLKPLEDAMAGTVELDKSGRFYLRNASGRMEMPLVAEGLRKFAMLAQLIATGALLDKGYLFWDEPEANLNPRLVKQVARSIVALSQSGLQMFLATHSLFLLRELEILLAEAGDDAPSAHFFGLQPGDEGVKVQQGTSLDDIGDFAALEESLQQSDRYLAAEV
ncbi:MAG TPA: AAA family ATPase [Rhodanobacteraceae bacterium]